MYTTPQLIVRTYVTKNVIPPYLAIIKTSDLFTKTLFSAGMYYIYTLMYYWHKDLDHWSFTHLYTIVHMCSFHLLIVKMNGIGIKRPRWPKKDN